MRREIRGGWRLFEALAKRGALDRPVLYPLTDSIRIEVPIGRNSWDAIDLAEYESELMALVKQSLDRLSGPVTLIDAGADIGLFSLKACSLCPSVSQIFCFEPNSAIFPYLERNLKQFSFPTEAIAKAVSDFTGRGALHAPQYDSTDHGRYLAASPDGPIAVTSVDGLSLPCIENLLFKLDIEGGELAAVRGARATVLSAKRAIVVLEAHPKVAERTGTDPLESVRLLNSWRPFRFAVAEQPHTAISLDRPFFDQFDSARIYNLVGESL